MKDVECRVQDAGVRGLGPTLAREPPTPPAQCPSGDTAAKGLGVSSSPTPRSTSIDQLNLVLD